MKHFADETMICSSGCNYTDIVSKIIEGLENIADIVNKINEYLENLASYLSDNTTYLNIRKYIALIIMYTSRNVSATKCIVTITVVGGENV